jgi:hypothetical protein
LIKQKSIRVKCCYLLKMNLYFDNINIRYPLFVIRYSKTMDDERETILIYKVAYHK